MTGKNKSRLLFILTVTALFVLVSYLGAHTIRHEALLAQQRADAIVQARLMSIQDFFLICSNKKQPIWTLLPITSS